MLFNFRFFPFEELITEIDYREEPTEERNLHRVHWLWLTDGWYWIDVGSTQLFRYTQQAYDLMKPPRSANGRYVDYFVSRLWEDILVILPAVLEPIPSPLWERLSSISNWNDWLADKDEMWEVHVSTQEGEEDEEDEFEQEAVYLPHVVDEWWGERRLDTFYLVSGPRIWFWSDGTLMHIAWDNRKRLFENDVPAWDADVGEIVLPVTQFLVELHDFNQRLMDAMATRVALAPAYWTDPQLAEDLTMLQEEQRERSTWLAKALREEKNREATNWQSVLTSISIIENDPVFTTVYTSRNKR